MQGQKRQLNKVSRLNSVLFKPGEAYDFWEYLTGKDIDFSRGFLLNDTATEKDRKRIRAAFTKLVQYQGKRRLAFKITGPARIGYLKSIFPDAIFINIIRNPYDTIHSWLHVDFWQDKGKNQLWWTGAYTKEEESWAIENASNPEALAALQYKKLMDTTFQEIEGHSARCLNIHYEDFVAEPGKIIGAIMEFAELPQSGLVDQYLSNIKIYNQNKSKISKLNRKSLELVETILGGTYDFSRGMELKS